MSSIGAGSAEIAAVKGLPPKNVRSAAYISGCASNRRMAVIGLMESYRILPVYPLEPMILPHRLF